jgi:aminoglycoside phosphotransferase (APT) family kinase protein
MLLLTLNYLAMNNMLFDKTTNRVTALLDFDFSCVTHPVHEFFIGLWDLGGDTHPDNEELRSAILSGKFRDADDTLPPADRVKWEIAKAWDSALAAKGAIRPSSIQGIDKLERLREIEQALCPFHLSNEVMVERAKQKSPEKLQDGVKAATDNLIALLEVS